MAHSFDKHVIQLIGPEATAPACLMAVLSASLAASCVTMFILARGGR